MRIPERRRLDPAHRRALIHVPTLYSTYTPRNGNAINTVVHGYARAAAAREIPSSVLVSEDRDHDYGDPLIMARVGRPQGKQFVPRWHLGVDLAVTSLVRVRPPMARHYYRSLGRSLRDHPGTLVVFNQPSLARVLRAEFPARPIFHYAQNEPFGRSTLRSARAVLDDVDGVICCSGFIAQRAALQTGRNDTKIVGVLNGVDSTAFSPRPAERSGPPVVLFVGRVSLHKGVHHLVDAALELQRRGVEFRLRIVGSSDLLTVAELSEYERNLRVAADPLGDRCEFLPFVDRSAIADVYRSADVMTVPSAFDEPFGLVALEAQACGLPLVASNRGGLPEAGGAAGRYVDVADPVAFADVLEPLLVDPELRRRVSIESRQWAESLDWHHQFDELLAVTGVEPP